MRRQLHQKQLSAQVWKVLESICYCLSSKIYACPFVSCCCCLISTLYGLSSIDAIFRAASSCDIDPYLIARRQLVLHLVCLWIDRQLIFCGYFLSLFILLIFLLLPIDTPQYALFVTKWYYVMYASELSKFQAFCSVLVVNVMPAVNELDWNWNYYTIYGIQDAILVLLVGIENRQLVILKSNHLAAYLYVFQFPNYNSWNGSMVFLLSLERTRVNTYSTHVYRGQQYACREGDICNVSLRVTKIVKGEAWWASCISLYGVSNDLFIISIKALNGF